MVCNMPVAKQQNNINENKNVENNKTAIMITKTQKNNGNSSKNNKIDQNLNDEQHLL